MFCLTQLVTRFARSRTRLVKARARSKVFWLVVSLIIVSTPGPGFFKVKVRYVQNGDEVGQGFV